MRTATQTVWLTTLLLVVGCHEDGGSTTTNEDCQDPPFVADTPLAYAPCGCSNQSYESPWSKACDADDNFRCVIYSQGSMCLPKCEADGDCPDHPSGLKASCEFGSCELPCDAGALACPESLECIDGYCRLTFPPEPTD